MSVAINGTGSITGIDQGFNVTSGNLGIGTDNPGARTHIDSVTSNTPLVVEASENNRSRVVFRNNVETGTECNIELFDDDLRFVTNSGERLRITSNGNIGVGVANPGQKLTVKGTTSLMATNSTNQWMAYTYTDNTFRLNYNGSGADEITVLSSGEVSIGGFTPTAGDGILQIAGGLRVAGSASASDTTSPYIYRTSGVDNLNFATSGVERVSIRSDGRVTIGAQVINTNSMLSIHRGSSDESQIRFTNTTTGEGGNNGLLVGIDSNEHGRIFNQENTPLRFGTNNTERLRIDSSGRLMLGTTTEGFATYGDKLTIADSGHCGMTIRSGTSSYGTIYFSDGDDGSADEVRGFIDYNHSNNQLQLGTDGATRIRITSSGITQQRDLSGNYHVIASSRDGSTSARAATSAWEIKKTLGPDAKTGYYYLTNPYDNTTQQWWCDMETDGGGWILVAFTGDGQMASNPGNWYDRNNKGGFNGLTQGFYRGGGYWNTWGDLKGQLMWECRTLDTYFNSSSCSKVGINWGKTNNLPTTGTRAYSNITGNANTLFENWCWDIYNAPGFEPSNYEQHARNNRIGGANYFTEHMVITWSFRSTSGSADDGSNGPYWMIGAHHDGLHQHYEESLSGGDGANGDGGYQVVSNEDTTWGGGGQQHSMNRLARHNQDGGSVFVWMR